MTVRWRDVVRRHAESIGVELPLHAIDELATHLEDLFRAEVAAGAPVDVAEQRARAALTESDLRTLRGPALRQRHPTLALPGPRPNPLRSLSMTQSLMLALRQFRTQPGFALVTVLVLGLGIGAAVTVYTIVDSVVLRPLPYTAPDRLVTIWDTNHETGLQREPISPVNFMDYRVLDVFSDAAAWWRPDVNLVDPGMEPARVATIETGANLFAVLGVSPQVGPGFPVDGPMFNPSELLAVISDRLWRSRYQADRALIGKTIQLNNRAYTVVGVMPPRFDFPGDIDVWQRSTWDFTQHSRSAHFMEAVARLKPDVTIPQADGAATTLAKRLEAQFPQTNRAWSVRLIPLLEQQLGYYRPALLVSFGAVALLMVIGCLNVASLLLTRALSRDREVAVRAALGASPRHIVTQLLAEAGVLSIAGAIAGVLGAVAALPLILSLTPVEIPRLDEAAINPRVLAFALAAAVGATLLFGLLPAIALVRRTLTMDLKSSERGSSRAGRAIYRGLVAGEVALAAALLVGSGLLIRTVSGMTSVPTGVRTDDAVITSVQLAAAGYPDWGHAARLHSALVEHVRQQPGVRAAGAGNFLPLEPGWRVPYAVEGRPIPSQQDAPQAQYHTVSDGYFEALGAPLVAGRPFNGLETPLTTGVVIVNESFVRQAFPNESPIGRVLLSGAAGIGPLGRNLLHPRWQPAAAAPAAAPAAAAAAPAAARPGAAAPVLVRFEIIGVVADVKNVPLAQPTEPAIYFTSRQFPFRAMSIVVDAAESGLAIDAVKKALRAVAPDVPLAAVTTWEARMRSRTAEPRLLMTVLVFFAALAALLAALGVYGLFSWSVALRRRELAIRLTLGARPSSVGAMVLRQGVLLVGIGLVAGWALVQLTSRLLSSVLFGVGATDPASAIVAGGVLFAAAVVACVPPAIKAMRTDPVNGLRAE